MCAGVKNETKISSLSKKKKKKRHMRVLVYLRASCCSLSSLVKETRDATEAPQFRLLPLLLLRKRRSRRKKPEESVERRQTGGQRKRRFAFLS